MSQSAAANWNRSLQGVLPGDGLADAARRLSIGCASVVTLAGLVLLSGWALGVDRLKNLSPGTVSMKPNAAVALALCGLALLLCHSQRGSSRTRSATLALVSVLVAATGMLTLLEYVFGADLGIDQVLFHEPSGTAGTPYPGRMAVATALALALSAGALGLVALGKAVAQQVAAGAVLLIALSALLGYLYGADLTRPWGTTELSAYTVVVLMVLGLGLLTARSQAGLVGALLRNEPGGLMARWLLLAALIALPILGLLRLAGQLAGLYSARAGVGIMVLASVMVLVVTVAVTGARVNALGRQRSLALDRLAGSERRLRRALDHLLHVQDNERRGLAMDLHDDALPALGAIGLQLELAREQCRDPDTSERLGRAESELRATSLRLRHLMFDLVPEALDREGLGGVLRHRLEQMRGLTGIDYELVDRVGTGPSPQAAAVLYRIAVEALRNVARHAHASRVRVELQSTDGRVEVTVADDGVGFRPSPPRRGHFGLSIMTERAELAGGAISIDSRPGAGSTLVFWIPAGVDEVLEAG
jgi:signal transduction histidine kinase